jgi:Tfp pilus tip-associated adhesin PilY1
MNYYVKNDLSLILDARYQEEGDRIVYRRAGKVQGDYPLVDFTKLDVTDEKATYGVNKYLFKLVDGVPKVHTITHLRNRKTEKLKANAINEAESLYKSLKAKRCVIVDSIEYDLSDSFEFDYQRRGNGSIRVKQKNNKTKVMSKQDTDAIETALFTYLNSVADAFDADLDAIELEDYSLTNLNALL